MKDPQRCRECHSATPVQGRDDYTTVTFTDEIVALCSRCHQEEHYREEHPVEIRPELEVPEELHLDNYYTMTCATCHDPHGEFESEQRLVPVSFFEKTRFFLRRQRRFPTYFLRMSNTKGELCLSCHRGGTVAKERLEIERDVFPQYVGSEGCQECHPKIYQEWRRTLHARNFQDVSKNPDSVLATFEGDKPFPPGKVLYVVGQHWTQRYVIQGKKGPMVRPESWSIGAKKWIKGGSFSRPWLRYCGGCHATALNPFDGRFLEAGTGCESCHGPGRSHAQTTDQFEIVNPAALVEERRNMICESCHTSGHDRSGVYRYPIGYRPGQDLMRYFRGLVPKPGQDTSNFAGDGSYKDRHRQYLYWISRSNIMVGMTCDICLSHRRPREGEIGSEYFLTPDEMCGTCHRDNLERYREHSRHSREQAGCLDCHPPLVAGSRDRYSIHDHKFQFGKPPPELLEGGDPCLRCHPEISAAGRSEATGG